MVTIRPASDRSLLVTLGKDISSETHARVARMMRSLLGVRGILNLHPAYASVLVDFDPRSHAHGDIEGLVRERWEALEYAESCSGGGENRRDPRCLWR